MVQALLCENRKMEAAVAAMARKVEREKMRQADLEAEALQALQRQGQLLKAYHPLMHRVSAAESIAKLEKRRAEDLTADLQHCKMECATLKQRLTQEQTEHAHLLSIERNHQELHLRHAALQQDLVEVLCCLVTALLRKIHKLRLNAMLSRMLRVQLTRETRPMRLLNLARRNQVQHLQQQLADILELHADSAAFARKTEAQITALNQLLDEANMRARSSQEANATLQKEIEIINSDKAS
jgi:hypothetical protein